MRKIVWLKVVLDEPAKNNNCVRSWPLNTFLFNILCREIRGMHKTLLLHTLLWLSWWKALMQVSCKAELTPFILMKHHFYLKEQLTNDGYSDFGIWYTFSLKWTKWTCYFKKTVDRKVRMVKFDLSSKNWNLRKLLSATVIWQLPNTYRLFTWNWWW